MGLATRGLGSVWLGARVGFPHLECPWSFSSSFKKLPETFHFHANMPLYEYRTLKELAYKAQDAANDLALLYGELSMSLKTIIRKTHPPIDQICTDDPLPRGEPILAMMLSNKLRSGESLRVKDGNKLMPRVVQTLNEVLRLLPEFRELQRWLDTESVELYMIMKQKGSHSANRGCLGSFWWWVYDGRVEVREGLPAGIVGEWQDRLEGWLCRVEVVRGMVDMVAELQDICASLDIIESEH
ncbi:hypothetical protein BJ508DRAFT_365380 [Ascobolus immersus RN42]|uniref:Uncharacterized protein n=1 Tax=Ascobolus immersus RN42 TaxID=1160509 RepID=A0A3N4HSB3_ASCIM|nr:hypothetical protein BJ508DRAFT_365380 [Ascobolus immersus RN42]